MFNHLNLNNGKNLVCDKTFHPDMLMDVAVYVLEKDEKLEIYSEDKESAILLLTGKGHYDYEGNSVKVSRSDVFEEKPYCLHVSKDTKVVVEANEYTEVLVQSKENGNDFESVMYTPENSHEVIAGVEEYEGTSKRIIRTIFDYSTAPYSNMVIGEVISYTGRWNSYPPHHHPQPEVYFYKFNHPAGFGVSIIDDNAEVVRNNSASYIPGGVVHPQATAPGYRMYYVWMIPHFENKPWTERIFAEEHKWLVGATKYK